MEKEYKRFEHPTCPGLFLRFTWDITGHSYGEIKYLFSYVGNTKGTCIRNFDFWWEADLEVERYKKFWEKCHTLPETFYKYDNSGVCGCYDKDIHLLERKLMEWSDIFVFDLVWDESFSFKFRMQQNIYEIEGFHYFLLKVNEFDGISIFGDTVDDVFELFIPNKLIREYKLNQITNGEGI